MQLPLNLVDHICKMIPYNPAQPTSLSDTLGDEKIHRECFEDWWKIEYPKHKDNMPVEINKLWEGDEDYYVDMCKFLEMKPLNNWKEHIIEFNNIYDR